MKEEFKLYSTNAGKNKKHIIEVSNKGNVKVDGKLYDLSKSHGRYKQVHLLYVHRMVAELFVPNPENKPFVDHIDSNTYNNTATNLRWVTYLENNRNPNTIKKMKAGWNKPGVRESHAASNKRYADEHPEWKQQQSERMKEYFSNPENREKHSKRMKEVMTQSETKDKMKNRKYLTDGIWTLYVKPEYWGELIDNGFVFGKHIK